jgi:hypothetical protein
VQALKPDPAAAGFDQATTGPAASGASAGESSIPICPTAPPSARISIDAASARPASACASRDRWTAQVPSPRSATIPVAPETFPSALFERRVVAEQVVGRRRDRLRPLLGGGTGPAEVDRESGRRDDEHGEQDGSRERPLLRSREDLGADAGHRVARGRGNRRLRGRCGAR